MANAAHDSLVTHGLDLRGTALVVVDPYNDFMGEGGKLYERTRETTEAVGFYTNMRSDFGDPGGIDYSWKENLTIRKLEIAA